MVWGACRRDVDCLKVLLPLAFLLLLLLLFFFVFFFPEIIFLVVEAEQMKPCGR